MRPYIYLKHITTTSASNKINCSVRLCDMFLFISRSTINILENTIHCYTFILNVFALSFTIYMHVKPLLLLKCMNFLINRSDFMH